MKQIKEIISTKTFSHSLITFSGTAINGVLGILFFVFLARFLGPERFGTVSVTIVTLTLIADIADMGINTGIINFLPKFIASDKIKAYKIMKLALRYKLLSWLVVLLTGFFLSGHISNLLFQKPVLENYLRLSFIGVGGALLFSFVTNCLQAYQKYVYWSILNAFLNGLRLLVVLILAYVNLLDSYSVTYTYILIPFLGFFLGLLMIPVKFVFVKNENSEAKNFLSYNKWVALSILLAALYSRIDTFFVARFLQISEVGFYQVAVQLTFVVPQIVYALAVVVAPKLASYTNDNEAFFYLKKMQYFTLGLGLIGLMIIPLSFYLIPFFYSEIYASSVGPFTILMLAQTLFLISTPAHQAIFYYFSNPKVFVFILFLQLASITLLSWYLIPIYGIIGAASAVLVGNILNFLATNFLVLRRFKKI